MNAELHSLIAYCATLFGIILLAALAAVICLQYDKTNLPQIVAALSFIGAAVTGLIGVIGTFRPRAAAVANTERGDVNVETK